MKRFFSIIILALISLNAYAGLSKWVDAEGKVHYSDTPPPEVETQTVRNISGNSQADAPPSFTPKSLAEREAEIKKSKKAKEDASQKAVEQEAVTAAKRHNCESARQNAKTIEDKVRITTYDANGQRVIMDEATRAKKLEEARQTMQNNCD